MQCGQQDQLTYILRESKLFEGLNGSVLDDLRSRLSVRMLHRGDCLMEEGEESGTMHIVISGRLQVATRQLDGSLRVLVDVGRGETIGETGLLTGNKRSASVYALRDTLVAELSRDSFYFLISKYPEVMTKRLIGDYVLRLLRQIQGNGANTNTLATFTVIASREDVSLDEFCTSLSQALARFGPCLHLSSDYLDQLLGKQGIAQTGKDEAGHMALANWLSEQETHFRYVIYQADRRPTAWTNRCLRQADRVLIVARAQSEAASTGCMVSWLREQGKTVARSLVLLHEADVLSPHSTKHWIDQMQPASHHHVRWRDPRAFAQLARVLTGRGVGLVLSGGGARGFAHIGALRALEEASLEIDLVGGTSMGAVIAAQCAMGWNSERMLDRIRRAVSRHHKFQYTLPLVSVLTGASWKQFLVELFGDTRIEDLWLNYFCCSTNLIESQVTVHDTGVLWEALRASSSIPGLLPPMFDTGKLLVDGGVLNNMPIDIMRERNDGTKIIAVDVAGRLEAGDWSALGPVLSGWRLLFRRQKENNPLPGITTILMRCATMGSQAAQRSAQRIADLYINPDISDHGLLDFNEVDRIVEKGYRCAQAEIAQWQDAASRKNG